MPDPEKSAIGDSNVRGAYEHIPNALTTGGQKWWHNKGVRQLNFFITVIYCGQFLNGIDDNLLGGFQSLPAWRKAVGSPSQSAIGLLSSSAYIAGFFTAPIASYVADRWGRKWCIRWSAFTAFLGSLIGSLAGLNHSSGYALFITSRIIFGSGLAFSLMISPILLQELPHPTQRVTLAAIFNLNYAFGSFLLAWYLFGMSYVSGNWSWRSAYLLQIIPAAYMAIAINFVPETPRWLMSKGREQEAMNFLVKYHGNGDPNDELVLFEFEEMKEAIKIEREMKQDTWAQAFATKGNRHRMAIVLLIVICQNLSGSAIAAGYYGQILNLVGITGSTQQTGINAGLTGTVFFCALFGATIVKKLPRRKMLLTTWTCLLLVQIGLTITAAQFSLTGSLAAARANVAMLFLFLGTFFVVCGPLFFSYQTECLSYSIRAKGMMVWGISNKILSIFNAYVNSIALEHIGYKYYIVYCVLLFVQLVAMYFLIVETKGFTLEEIAVLFDGENTAHVVVNPYETGAHSGKKGAVSIGVQDVSE
ncbi:general substrate transporter [Meredithblackwellia eburnea MCA 4105]